MEDDPLSLSATSVWARYWSDRGLWEEIAKDCVRTHPDIQVVRKEEVAPPLGCRGGWHAHG